MTLLDRGPGAGTRKGPALAVHTQLWHKSVVHSIEDILASGYTMAHYTRLTKSRTDRMIGGVCGGFAEYAKVDVTLIRIAMVFLALLGGLGILLYLIALVIVPEGEKSLQEGEPPGENRNGARIAGIILVGLGAFFFLKNLGFPFWEPIWDFPWRFAFPMLLIGIGAWIVFGKRAHPADPPAGAVPVSPAAGDGTQRLSRSRTDSKLFGVCGGIGMYLNTDPTIVRILFIVGAFVSAGLMVLLYFILAIVLPLEAAPSPQTEG